MATAADAPDLSAYHEKSRKVLLAVHAAGGEANTGTVREHSGLTGNLVWNHAQTLVGDGLLVEAGKDESSTAPIAPNVYRLTDRGRAAAREHTEDDTLSVEARISRLESEVATLRVEREELREELRAATSERDNAAERIGELERRFERLRETIRSEDYIDWLRNSLRKS